MRVFEPQLVQQMLLLAARMALDSECQDMALLLLHLLVLPCSLPTR